MSAIDFDHIAKTISPEQLDRSIGARPSRSRGEFHCPSPAHENGDRNPSLSISRKNGRTVAYCHSCGLTGTPVQVAAELWGMSSNDAAERLVSELRITNGPPGPSGKGSHGTVLGELIHTYD